MRVTQSMLSNNMLRNLSNSNANMSTYMDQLTTGKKINRPSDDPVVAMKGINYRSQVSEIKQFKRNTSEVHNWMDNTDAALNTATQALQKLRELAVQASNDTYDEQERENIMKEAEQLKQHLIDIANTNVNGKHIFNGTNTNASPFNENDEFIPNTDKVTIEVASGMKLDANINPEAAFGNDLFDNLQGFITALDDNDQSGIQESIENIDEGINQIINTRADLGARMNRLDLIENRLAEQEIVATKTMSDNEDVDYAETITKLITQESLHRAALSAGSRIIQPSLVDFLR
ncbi:flagellar hook-associated protein FlgL [Virgibacillus sp. YIM 98842]|uniref:flagellar hook-associated protein FlgL n=1 Tax=Virgibacillus sp. YIM 98842 TaxID=2663533 RepID=UPI0013DB90F0|nr:flagellar hook-associated protein FlgL [Virgibacillus sp. YIM 98842]